MVTSCGGIGDEETKCKQAFNSWRMSRRQNGQPPPSSRDVRAPSSSTQLSDIQNLLLVVRSHQRQHEDGTYNASKVHRCHAMLNKLKKVLPKLLRSISVLQADQAIPMLSDLCDLLQLLLQARACPHSTIVFIDTPPEDSRQASGSTLSIRPFPTIATLLLYMVSFFCNRQLRDVKADVLDVIIQAIVILQRQDAHASLHFFQDSVDLLEDCVLVEQCMSRSHAEEDKQGVVISCFLNTAIHAFHGSEGALGSESTDVLCGCAPAHDTTAVQRRKEQLKAMLPALRVSSYSSASDLRGCIEQLVDRLVCVCGQDVRQHEAYQRLTLLAEHLIELDRLLLAMQSPYARVHGNDKVETASMTCTLLVTLLSMKRSTERPVVRVAQAFLRNAIIYANQEELHAIVAATLGEVSSCLRSMPTLAREEVWYTIARWYHFEMVEWCERTATATSILLETLRLYQSMTDIAPEEVLMFVLEMVRQNTTVQDHEDVQVLVVGLIHQRLSFPAKLEPFARALVHKITVSSRLSIEQEQPKGKRRRLSPESSSRSIKSLDVMLSEYLSELLSADGDSDARSLVLALRCLLPLRPFAERVARVEAISIIRYVMQRVEHVVQRCDQLDHRFASDDFTRLLTLLGGHLHDYELGKFRIVFERVLSTMDDVVSKMLQNNKSQRHTNVTRDAVTRTIKALISLTVHTVDDAPGSVRQWLDDRAAFSTSQFELDTALQRILLLIYVWKNPRVFMLTAENWSDTLPGRLLKGFCNSTKVTEVLKGSVLRFLPVLVFLLLEAHSPCTTKESGTIVRRMIESIKQSLVANPADHATQAACLEAVEDILCLYGLKDSSSSELRISAWCSGESSPAKSNGSFKIEDVEVVRAAVSCISEAAAFQHHSTMSASLALAARLLCTSSHVMERQHQVDLVDLLCNSITHTDRHVRRAAVRCLWHCLELSSFVDILFESPSPQATRSVTESIGVGIERAMKERDYLLLESCIEAISAIGCSRHVTDQKHREFIVWSVLQLTFIWVNTRTGVRSVSTAAFDQMQRVFLHRKTSWKELFLVCPEDVYFPVIDCLLRAKSLKPFVSTFIGAHFDESVLLRDGAPYVLPQYVILRHEDMMKLFLDAYTGDQFDDDVLMEDEEFAEVFPTTKMTLSSLIEQHLAYIVKELIIHQMEAESKEDAIKEWEFLFQFFSEKTTIGDVINHSALRILSLVTLELGGDRASAARKAFREVCHHLMKGSKNAMGEVDVSLMMPRQFFLALMTDLGNRIGQNGSPTNRVRAIRSIYRLFNMFKHEYGSKTSGMNGALDPFVPKVMAILKIGLSEADLQDDAVHAWSIFIRLLTTKALESNFASIVVSILPCIQPQQHNGLDAARQPRSEDELPVAQTAKNDTAARTAIAVLKYLFIDRRSELSQAFPRVRLFPLVPALDGVYASYVTEVGDPKTRSLIDILESCLPFITHWDQSVREVVLEEVHDALESRATQLSSLVQSEDNGVDPAVLDVLFAILHVTKTDTSESVRLLCAKCLGALGAIDSARIPMYGNQAPAARSRSESRVEHSTKDLACVLIETWLVKELRAAPENTDAIGLSIQELLKFLAELTEDPQHSGLQLDSLTKSAGERAKSSELPPMPDWIKRRFERKEVLEFVEPYWYTNYSLTAVRKPRIRGITTFYEQFTTTYEEWLSLWSRRLIDLSQPPESKIFQACQKVISTSPQIGRFLLTYLIQNVLRSGRPDVYEEVKREVMAVLNDDGVMDEDAKSGSFRGRSRTEDSSERAFGEYASRHHQCAQTIVSTIDELNEWVWSNEKKRFSLSASASRSTASTPGNVPSDLDDQEKENLEEFLKDIPSQSLSSSAFRIKAYARALQYFEVYLRQQQPEPKAKESASTSSMPTFPVDLKLISKHATYLQQLYSRVDEPDALTGLATLRRLYEAYRHTDPSMARAQEPDDYTSSLTDLLHQVVDHEQLAQWEDALACYEQAIQEVHTQQAAHAFYPSESADDRDRDSFGVAKDPRSVKPSLYSGIVHCLIQLGRLESALQHINGIVTQEPQFVGTLYPHALECAWRLSRWDLVSELLNSEQQTSLLSNSLAQGGVSSRLRNLEVSQLSLVRVLHSFHAEDAVSLQKSIREARIEIMGPLAAACAESYQRAYPLLHKLHFLHEVEQGFISLQASKHVDAPERVKTWQNQCPWDARYELLPSSLKFRDPILAVRRVMLQQAELRAEVSENWLSYAKIARKEGYIRTANSAIMHAEALENPYATLEKAKLMVAQGRMYEALQILEPVDIDASKLDYNVDDPHYCAKNLLLATNWMQASGQRQGKKVVQRYEAVIKFDPKWEKGYFFLAKYYEYLLSVSHPEAPTTLSASGSSRAEDSVVNVDSVFHSHLISVMRNYIMALSHGTKHVFQSMPRLLTLWFEYGELLQPGANKGSSMVNKAMRSIEMELSQSSIEQMILSDITQLMNSAADKLPAYEWLVCFPQVTSRICHPTPAVVDGVKRILLKVLTTYPAQAMWPLLGLSRSLNAQRRNRAREIITATQRHFASLDEQELANSFAEGQRLVEELITLASHDPANQRKIHIRLTRVRTKILVPVQAGLNTVLPSSGLAPRDDNHVAFMPHSQVYIKAFSDKADVMMTKEKPKRIEFLGTDGQPYPFLCKREKTGDLRKDARMMEFNTMINKLLQKDREGRKRKLRLRTYAVVCLNEESGLMEWVRDTKAMRQLIGQIHKTERGLIQPVRLTHEIKERFLYMQKKHGEDPVMLALYYRSKILNLPVFTPRFHQWFTNNFSDPTAWFEARLVFTRSAAVWSMVGHIIGLGDRHCENILVDCTNGECVHVDFDCLFDKGLKLAKPEIVPFRLTPNIIDAFGVTGYEGVFRRVCEVTMELLRNNRETLRSVLESFIHDPLVEWGRRGKTAQGMAAANAAGRSIADISSDRSKEETRVILKTIDDRLSGIYNLGDAIRPLVSSSHRSLLPENETLPLSVQGQVDKLIHEATSHANLAQMYIGWMPFL